MFSAFFIGLAALIVQSGHAKPGDYFSVEAGASVYSSLEATDRNTWGRWWKGDTECAAGADDVPLRGTEVKSFGEITAIELDAVPAGCAKFKAGASDRKLAFVRKYRLEEASRDDQTEAGSTDVKCVNCGGNKSALRSVVNADPVLRAMANSGLGTRVGDEKTPEQTEQYMACHSTKWSSNYDRMYRRLYDLAGRTFQVTYDPKRAESVKALINPADLQSAKGNPFWVRADASAMKCLSLRESRWDPNAESETGAKGLGQQTTINVTEVGCLIAGCGDRKAAPWARDLWAAYFKNAREEFKNDPALYKELTTRADGSRCRDKMASKDLDAVCPINSIAAVAINKVAAVLNARKKTDLYKKSSIADFSEKERFELNQLTATTNNAGSGNLSKAVLGGSSTGEWLKRLPKVDGDVDRQKEIGDYQQFMKNCLQANNFNSVWPLKKGEKPKDCSPFRRVQSAAAQ